MNSEIFFEQLPPELMQPPAFMWEGPQPGIQAQADELRRYYFSPKTGKLESIVQYDDEGTPIARVRYRESISNSQNTIRPSEIEAWNGSEFVSHGLVEEGGTVVRAHSLPRTMIDVDGNEKKIPLDNASIFITPAGAVVELESLGSWLHAPTATYIGRVRGFNPLNPFSIRTATGEFELSTDQTDTVISPTGIVFEFNSAGGMDAIGEVVIPEIELGPARDAAEGKTIHLPHEMFDIYVAPQENNVRVDIKDEHLRALEAAPLHTIVGAHSFLHDTTPELIDAQGGVAAEEKLREVERGALELGLACYAVRREQRPQYHAAFLKAQHNLEDALWKKISVFESAVGVGQHTVINPALVRAWVERAATNPHEALLELRAAATPRYAA
ncbi:MAG: hypothetical protein NT003_02095 [Candidatus Magasanikbacteria bacterium]|nr:hypothetical protein [Candidatus Magasanikbacteria bacterium]